MKRKTGKLLNWVLMMGMVFSLVVTPALASGSTVVEMQPEPVISNPEFNAPANQTLDALKEFAPVVFASMQNDLSPALRDIALNYDAPEMAQRAVDLGFVLPKAQQSNGDGAFDSASVESEKPVSPNIPAPFQSFDGVGNLFGGWPPDTEGDIGPNHYMQWINVHYAIWQIDKVNHTSTLVVGPLPGSSLFAGFGGPCENTNDGDPIVLYDSYSNRWFASQFALPSFPNGPFYQCTAISQTSDPTGSWYRYQFQWPTNKMNDYPKFGVWPDAYYMTANQFNAGSLTWGGAGVVAFERAAMLQGLPAQAVYFDLFSINPNYGGMLPADADGPTPPPANAPGLFAEWDDSTWIGPNDAVRIWEFNVDWTTPGSSTFGISGAPNYTITTSNVDPNMCGYARACIPQPGTSAKLDAISDRIMHRLQYRNFGGHQSMVTNHTVDANGSDHGAPHWFELRDSGAGWVLHQEGVYAPDSTHRWMGSIAMDHVGNIALGYSASSSAVFPSVWYTGRLTGDPLGTLPQGEASIVDGTGSQTDMVYSRWGDYSSMNVDPVDDCTFWYTQEYVETTGSNTWKTRIGEFKLPTCVAGPSGILTGSVIDANTLAPIPWADIFADGGSDYSTTTNPGGTYTLTVAADTYTVTASVFGYLPDTVSAVTVVSGTTTTQDFALTPSTTASVSGVVSDAATGWPLYAEISITGVPGTIWTDPVTGYYTVTLPTGATYDFNVTAWVPGYNAANLSVGPLVGDTTQDFSLVADQVACTAPGYTRNNGIAEAFDATSAPSGWTVVNNGGTCPWEFDNPGGRANLTGGSGSFAAADSDACGSGTTMDTDLLSPVVDLSALASVPFEFKYDYNNLSASEVAAVDVSSNGGASWTNLVTWNTDQRGPATYSQDLTALLGGSTQAQLRFHYLAPSWDWWWEVDDVLLGIPTCDPPANGGLVVGNVYDENTQLPVTGASVTNDYGFSAAAIDTPGDNTVDDAFYTIFSPAGVGAVNHEAGFTDYGIDFAAVDVADGGTVGQDFYLPAGQLDASPPALAATLDFGQVVNQQVTLTNMGTISLTYNISEIAGGMIPSATAPDMVTNGDAVPWLSENPIAGALSGMPAAVPPFAAEPGRIAGGHEPAQEVVGDAEALSSAQPSALGLASRPFAPTSVLYDNGPLVTNPAGGFGGADLSMLQSTSLSMNTLGFGHQFLLGNRMADDFSISAPEGWLVDTITFFAYQTGSTITSTFTGGYLQIWDGPPDNPTSSVVWGDLVTNRLVNTTWSGIYRASETTTTSNNRPIMANTYALGAHLPAGSYWLDWSAAGVLGSGPWAPPVTILGQTTTGNALQYTGAWANANDSGSGTQQGMPFVIEGSLYDPQVVVDVTFDASVPEVDQPGEYTATLMVNNDSPYGPVNIPVTMFVNVPPTWGKLEGTVTGLGYCDASPSPLEAAQVIIEDSGGVTVTVMTDASGYYQRWFDESNGPFSLTVVDPDHTQGSASGVVISAGGVATQDFALRWLEPCMSAAPDSMEVTIAEGYTLSESLDLNNNGAAGSDFYVSELPGGYTTLLLGAKPLPNKTKSPDTEVSPWKHDVLSPVAVGGELFQLDVTAKTGHVCILGLEYALGSVWVTSGGQASCSTGTDNYLFRLAPDGTVLDSWNQNTTSTFGWRDLAFDGTYLYASDSAVVVQIDPATGAPTGVSIPAPTNPARALAYDPATDHFWTANFGSSIYEFDRTGAVVNTYPNSLSIYGAAWDMNSSGGPYLWVWSQDGTPAVLATQIDPASGVQTGVSFVGTSTDGTDSAGGATIVNGDYPGYAARLIFLGMHQASSDIVVGYDLDAYVDYDVPWMSEDPITGTLPADSSAPIDVSFNETMTFTLGTYTATMRISTDDPLAPTLFIPVTMHIVPPEYGVQISPDMGLTGTPGTTITYTVYITNTSNGPSDTFSLALGSSTFPSSPSATSVGPLVPGEMEMFTVAVDIPWGTPIGSTDAVVLTATSQGDGSKSDSVTLTTNVGAIPTIYLPVVPQGFTP